MHEIEKVKDLRHKLLNLVEEELLGDLSTIDACELGEVIDMIKDLSEIECNLKRHESVETCIEMLQEFWDKSGKEERSMIKKAVHKFTDFTTV